MSAPDVDRKTKTPHVQDMFVHALDQNHLQARPLLFASWSASAENLKLIHRRQRMFFTTLKENRRVSLSPEEGYVHLDAVEWTPERLSAGVVVKWKQGPVKGRLFKLVAPDGAIAWVITKDLAEPLTAQGAKDTSDVRWQVEELHHRKDTPVRHIK